MITPININDIPARWNENPIIKDLEEFCSSEELAVEAAIRNGTTAAKICQNYRYAVKRGGFPVKVIRRGDRVFLVKDGCHAE